ncbi:hypothetical protein [Lysobacter gummosus]
MNICIRWVANKPRRCEPAEYARRAEGSPAVKWPGTTCAHLPTCKACP